jgi:hypothetical protein
MANHCYNYATFHGDEAGIVRLHKRLLKILSEQERGYGGIHFDISNYHTVLFGKRNNKVDAYDSFGSKWFECEFELDFFDEKVCSVTLMGDSAWSPMTPLFIKICKKYDLQCNGNYEESGMDFAGEFSIDAEGTCEVEETTYQEFQQKHNPESYWDTVITDIQDGYCETFEAVLERFNPHIWELNKSEIAELRTYFNDYKDSLGEINNDQETI